MQEIPVAKDLQVGWKLAFVLKRFSLFECFCFAAKHTKLNFIKLLPVHSFNYCWPRANYSLF